LLSPYGTEKSGLSNRIEDVLKGFGKFNAGWQGAPDRGGRKTVGKVYREHLESLIDPPIKAFYNLISFT